MRIITSFLDYLGRFQALGSILVFLGFGGVLVGVGAFVSAILSQTPVWQLLALLMAVITLSIWVLIGAYRLEALIIARQSNVPTPALTELADRIIRLERMVTDPDRPVSPLQAVAAAPRIRWLSEQERRLNLQLNALEKAWGPLAAQLCSVPVQITGPNPTHTAEEIWSLNVKAIGETAAQLCEAPPQLCVEVKAVNLAKPVPGEEGIDIEERRIEYRNRYWIHQNVVHQTKKLIDKVKKTIINDEALIVEYGRIHGKVIR